MYISITVGGLVGGWLGSLIDGGGGCGLWSILLSTVGSVLGIWVAYKISQNS
jgi:uncharacterized membrane protein YeaQ/YmgE (transglycosylase-associated protein family)